jgi:preprotein translocase subunit SecD
MIGRFLCWAVVPIICLAALCSCKGGRDAPDIENEGGTVITIRVTPNIDEAGRNIPVSDEDVSYTVAVIERRLDAAGFRRFAVSPVDPGEQNDVRISVQLPPLEAEALAHTLGLLESTARLELKAVNLQGFETDAGGRSLAERVLAGDEIVPGHKAYERAYDDHDGNMHTECLLLSRKTALGGQDIEVAMPSAYDPTQIDITLNGDGERKMMAFTKSMTPGRDRIAIVLDDEVLSAPVVQSVPLGKQFVITGQDDKQQAETLAHALSAPLRNALTILAVEEISPAKGGGEAAR